MKGALILSLVVYIIQILVIGVMFFDDGYKKKSDLLRDLLPFYWLGHIILFTYNVFSDNWNKLQD